MILTWISAAVRIGCSRVRQFFGKPFRREPMGFWAYAEGDSNYFEKKDS
jgi:hypothetical protein